MNVRQPVAGLALALSAAMVASLSMLACSASAAFTHKFISSFGSFARVEGTAVDQSSQDVYVYDAGAGAVYKFDLSGAAAAFTGIAGEPNVIEGVGGAGEAEDEIAVDNSAGPAKGDIYVANGSHVAIYAPDGKSLGELSQEEGKPWGEPCGVAVDSTGSNRSVGWLAQLSSGTGSPRAWAAMASVR